MAMHLLPSHHLFSFSMPFTLFFAILSVISLFSVITFLCGSEKLKKFHTETEKAATRSKLVSKLNSNLGNRALSMVKMLSWRKVQAEGEEVESHNYSDHDHDDEEALWRKNILMGEKCRPLNLSGKFDNDFEAKN